eukprot:5538249-Pyramimonas_sp.AAC.1
MPKLSPDTLKRRLSDARQEREAWKKSATALKRQNRRLRAILSEGMQSLDRWKYLPEISFPSEPGGALHRGGGPDLQ